jgi:dynein heavy chain 1
VEKYLNNKDFDLAKITRASSAAGPLAMWVKSIVEYAEIFEQIEPMRERIKELEDEEKKMADEYNEITKVISEIETKIETLKSDYEVLIGETQTIKSEMTQVQDKCERSVKLIENLSSERERWEKSSQNFKDQMSCLIGDTLLSAGFLTYYGFFDHYYRKYLIGEWNFAMDSINLKYRSDLSLTEFLSTPQSRHEWTKHELPNDELCIENAIIIKRFNRYPLIIDPSDQALKFILNHFASKKI